MKTEVIYADRILQFQRELRQNKQRLLRAKPFRDQDRKECFAVSYMAERD